MAAIKNIMRFKGLYILLMFLLIGRLGFAQACPVNISFEDGTFNGWKCYSDTIDASGNIAFRNPVPPDPFRHNIIKNTSPQALDPYGGFPVNCPNGSKYSIQLGNSGGGHQAERVSYTYTIPADNQDFSLIYYYAVVLQTPNHKLFEQPAFQANLTDITNGKEITTGQLECGNHVFTALAGLQGFKVSNVDKNTVYRSWSPVVVHLKGLGGHTIRLDFTTNDCVYRVHFGYAYLDFDDICDPAYDGLIKGNKVCAGLNSLTLVAPPGFESYAWYKASDMKSVLGSETTLKIDEAVEGTKYALVVNPYPDLGCTDTLYTTVKRIDEVFNLKVVQNMSGCKSDGIDLTQTSVTEGSSANLKFEYYTDAAGQNFISDPKRVTESGDYYIRGTNPLGCTDVAPIHLDLYKGSDVTIASHPPICAPAKYDLTKLATASDAGVTYTYYSDNNLQKVVANPQAIDKTGTYYVKATNYGVPCITVEAVALVISPLPKISKLKYASCPPLNLNNAIVQSDNTAGLTYKFYTDAAGTKPVADPENVTISGNYYYRAVNEYGCESAEIPLMDITVYPTPTFKVTDPAPVVYPQTINLADTHIPLTYADFTYWKDAAATKPLDNYRAIGESGTFYIKSINATGCIIIEPVHVLVNAPPEADLVAANTFTPNGDGINDDFRPTLQGVLTLNYIKIFNRYGKEIFHSRQTYTRWDGTLEGKPEPAGTYYWLFSAYDIFRKKQVMKSGSVTIIR